MENLDDISMNRLHKFELPNIIAKTKSTFLQNEKYIFQDFQLFPARLFDNRLIAA